MGKNANETNDRTEKKIYTKPELEKAERLEDVTEGAAVVVTGAVAD